MKGLNVIPIFSTNHIAAEIKPVEMGVPWSNKGFGSSDEQAGPFNENTLHYSSPVHTDYPGV